MVVEQIRCSGDNFSYLIYDDRSEKGALVDPGSDVSLALSYIGKLGLSLEVVIDTHHHADHTSENRSVKDRTGALIAVHALDADKVPGVDRLLHDGDQINIGSTEIEVIHTPGHSPGGICLIVDRAYLITGDTLFIDDCGRCDLPGGNLKDMFDSLQRIKGLPDHLIVLPGHDYGSMSSDELGNQKRNNRTLRARSLEEFSRIDRGSNGNIPY